MVNTASEAGHGEDQLLYLGHDKGPLRQANKETPFSPENEVIIAVRRCPEAGTRERRWKEGS